MKKRIVILGAGISGLSLGWFLHQKFGDTIDLKIIEKSSRVGGWIQTIEKNGFLFELGPHSCRAQPNNPSVLKLVDQLQMQDQIIFADPSANKRYLLHKQNLRSLPQNPLEFLFSPLMNGILKALFQEWHKPQGKEEDESIYEFISRRFNSQIAENLIDPLVSGIYAGDMRKLSIRSCFSLLYDYEKKYGSVVKGMLKRKKDNSVNDKSGIFSFKDGMEALPKELEKRLEKYLRKSSEVNQLKIDKKGLLKLKLLDGAVVEADYLFSTLSPKAMTKILSDEHSYIIRELNQFSSTSVCVVNLGYEGKVLKNKGFGYLVPSNEDEDILGVIWDSIVFPQQNRRVEETRLTVMMGGAKNMDLCHLSCKQQLQIAQNAVARHLSIAAIPKAVHVTTAQDAIPQYTVGHYKALQNIRDSLAKLSPNITLLGSSFDGVSLNDCAAQAEKVAEMEIE
jgi:oxygen-dependent protoporphyrinogen oxidase